MPKGMFQRLFTRKSDEESSEREPVEPEDTSEQNKNVDESELSEEAKKGRKGVLGKFESKVRRRVDSYVDKKAERIMGDAMERAEDFRRQTLDEVRAHAMELLDLTEERIDQKLVEVEELLETRLRNELKMRMRVLIWTLAFVLLMALVSLGYVWIKRSAGLDSASNDAVNVPTKSQSCQEV